MGSPSDFSLFHKYSVWLWVLSIVLLNVHQDSFPGVQQSEREGDQSCPSGVEALAVWSCVSNTSYEVSVWCLINHRDKFYIYFVGVNINSAFVLLPFLSFCLSFFPSLSFSLSSFSFFLYFPFLFNLLVIAQYLQHSVHP
jgi:hypothetical protein